MIGASGHVTVLGFLEFGIGFDPDVIRGATTISDAAVPNASPWFMLVGASVLLPLIVSDTAYAHRIFRGKAKAHEADR